MYIAKTYQEDVSQELTWSWEDGKDTGRSKGTEDQWVGYGCVSHGSLKDTIRDKVDVLLVLAIDT